MYTDLKSQLHAELDDIREAGTYKAERTLTTPQSAHVLAAMPGRSAQKVLNFCANNYLGLADHPDLIAAAKSSLDSHGFGMASVRFICGTQDTHVELERRVSEFLGTDDTILFSSCFDANGGVFESLFGPEDAIVSDELNHASLIDGIRLSKAARFRYRNADMDELRAQLETVRTLREGRGARRTVIVTDGVFSMDGYLAPLPEICDLADEFGALVLVDDSHAVGFMGATGAGTPEHFGVSDRVDLYTGTFGKALGGASGGYVSGHAEIIELLRQRARPYLFSNSLAPAIVAATLTALDLVAHSGDLRTRLFDNASLFRRRMSEEGFDLLPGEHAIVPVMFGDAALAGRIADSLLSHGVYVTAFSYPVVPQGKARIRVQLSAAHTPQDIEACVAAFVSARDEVMAADNC
ncbi:glycine C-acetyltransferase [Devriesea agamarum]|uniref:glycine C-acetyltransferase n=1 Tax=Devriesea agamarum TaxID=472569 RepID=UPI00071D63A4|nr:glycine C-acetyltransferase [Devriesea agamarum]